MDKETSDEKLLKIIEGTSELRRVGVNILGVKKPLGRAAGHLMRMKFNLAGLKNIFKDLKFNLVKINTALIGLEFFNSNFYLCFIQRSTISKSNAAYFIPVDSAAVVKFISIGEAQGLARKNIAGDSLRRDFFLPANQKVDGVTAGEDANVLDELKDFKLVGIIWSQNPEVMIENAKDSRTYIFKKGESYNEQFKIKEISRNSAILEINLGSGTQEYELR